MRKKAGFQGTAEDCLDWDTYEEGVADETLQAEFGVRQWRSYGPNNIGTSRKEEEWILPGAFRKNRP